MVVSAPEYRFPCYRNLGFLRQEYPSGDIPDRGSGNYASDEQKEIARLRRELRDAQDVLKKAINILPRF